MSLYATEDGFDESAKKLCHSFPVEVSGSTVRRIGIPFISQHHGKEIYQEERWRKYSPINVPFHNPG